MAGVVRTNDAVVGDPPLFRLDGMRSLAPFPERFAHFLVLSMGCQLGRGTPTAYDGLPRNWASTYRVKDVAGECQYLLWQSRLMEVVKR